jgi:hypothetical protein
MIIIKNVLIGLSIVTSFLLGFISCRLHIYSTHLFTIDPPVRLTGDLDLERDYFFGEAPKLKGVLGSGDTVYVQMTKGGAVYIAVPTVVSLESMDKATKK